jgi:uncharacterized protein YggE
MSILLTLALIGAAPMQPSSRSISVSGSADVRVAPDTVQLLLAVESWEKTIAKAKEANDERLKKTLATAAKVGIEARDIQTDNMNMEPIFESSSYGHTRLAQPDGYSVRRSVAITLRDVKRFEAVITALLEAGVNKVDGIDFRSSELRKHRDHARAMALKAAREKAVAMAGELGMKVGKASSVSESGGGGYYWSHRSNHGAMAQNVMQSTGPGGEDTEGFAPGQITISASVSVSFDLE